MSKAFTYENDFSAFIEARDFGKVVEVDEELFYYFLEVLPPRDMGFFKDIPGIGPLHISFSFAEGCEPLTYFWQKDGRSYAWREPSPRRIATAA